MPCGLKFRREFIAHTTCLRFVGTNFCKIVDSTIVDDTSLGHILGTTDLAIRRGCYFNSYFPFVIKSSKWSSKLRRRYPPCHLFICSTKNVLKLFVPETFQGLHAFKACFKRRATAVLSWLDCSSTAARH